jgi:hypothetical protein
MLLGAFLAGVMLNGLPPPPRRLFYLETFERAIGPLQEHVSRYTLSWLFPP